MIVRAPRVTRFTTVLNTFVEDGRLSLKAKGLLLFILSKPDGWHITVRGLISLPELGTDGRDAVVSALQELETCGYLTRERTRRGDGTWDWTSTITEEPASDGKSVQNPDEHTGDHDGKSENVGDVSEPPSIPENPTTMYGKTGHGKPGHIVNTDQVIDPLLSANADTKGVTASLALQVNAAMMAVHNAKNKAAALGDLHVLCFGFEPDYPRLGALAKKFTAAAVARQFVSLVGRPPADPLAYTQGVLENARTKTVETDGGAATGNGRVLGEGAQHTSRGAGRRGVGASNARPIATFVEVDD